jgi:ATP-dependent helicase HrpA
LAQHLVKRSYSEPHWEAKRTQVVAYEKVSLYGLDIVAKRKVNYGPIDPKLSHELFIRHALVEGDYHSRVSFLQYNRSLLNEVEELEHKARKKDVVVEPIILEQFYLERIPQDIYSGPQFEQWAKALTEAELKALRFDKNLLLQRDAIEVTENAYPKTLQFNSLLLPLSYHFEPGHPEDGVSLTVPLPVIKQIPEAVCSWLVPGLLADKITALIRALPKEYRRYCVPAPDYAKACFENLKDHSHQIHLHQALAQILNKMTGIDIDAKVWESVELAPHLLMNFKVIDDAGKVISMDRNLAALQGNLSAKAETSQAMSHDEFNRDGIVTWDFGNLPEKLQLKQHGITVEVYPAIVAKKDSVSLQVVPTQEQAASLTHLGLRKLLSLQLNQEIGYIKKLVPEVQKLLPYFSVLGDKPAYIEDFIASLLDQVFLQQALNIRNADSFNALLANRKNLTPTAIQFAKQLLLVLEPALQVAKQLQQKNVPLAHVSSMQDMRSQFQHLIAAGFMQNTPQPWFNRLPIYLKAMLRRLEKLHHDPQKERASAVIITPLWQQCLSKLATGKISSTLMEYRWLLEEFRVSLFAQELKTIAPVSEKRLNELWRNL